jgi:hypothetical protein
MLHPGDVFFLPLKTPLLHIGLLQMQRWNLDGHRGLLNSGRKKRERYSEFSATVSATVKGGLLPEREHPLIMAYIHTFNW